MFLGVFVVVFVLMLFRTPKMVEEEEDDDALEEEEEGLLASTGRRFGATWQDITGRAGRAKTGGDGRAGGRGNRQEGATDD